MKNPSTLENNFWLSMVRCLFVCNNNSYNDYEVKIVLSYGKKNFEWCLKGTTVTIGEFTLK